jgi:tetratricopeptide (TPR) repeat protein
MKNLKIIIILALLAGLYSPEVYSQSRKLAKKGAKLEEAGLPEEAADYYYKALVAKADNINALIGLKRTAPKLLDRKLQGMTTSYNNQDFQAAYDRYNDAATYTESTTKVGVELEITRLYTDRYNECRDILAEQYYNSGSALFDEGSYKLAMDDLQKCLVYRSPYKDAGDLIAEANEAKNVSDAERYYRSGLNKLSVEDYRGAYYDFGTCLSFKESYKDAELLRQEALEKGKVRIGIFEFTNNTKASGIHGTLYAYVVTYAVNCKSPFIEVVERDNLQRLLNEQKLGMSGVVDESTASQAGKVLGLDYVVMGRLIAYTKTGGEMTSRKVNAFELYPAKNAEGVEVNRGRAVTYALNEGSVSLTCEASYQVISVETSQIVSSEVVSASESDQVKYAFYNGDPKKLCKINPTDDFFSQAAISGNMVDQRLFSARQKLKSTDEMQSVVVKNLAQKISDGICGKFK